MMRTYLYRLMPVLMVGATALGGCGTTSPAPTTGTGSPSADSSPSADADRRGAVGFEGRWALDATITGGEATTAEAGGFTAVLEMRGDGTFEMTFATAASSSGTEGGTWTSRTGAEPQPGAGASATLLTASGEPFLVTITDDEDGLVLTRPGDDTVLVFTRS